MTRGAFVWVGEGVAGVHVGVGGDVLGGDEVAEVEGSLVGHVRMLVVKVV